jgi:hypothetical protein
MVKRLLSLFGMVSALLFAQPVFAWNKAGHMVSGAIAYAELQRESPTTVRRVVAVLRQHPDYEERWQPLLAQVPAEDRDLYLFMLAARWPDDAREEHDFDHPTWHYVNFPYKPGQPNTTPTVPSDEENILTAFHHNSAIAHGRNHPRDRAVALCWVFHLIGDVHQPLHTTKLVTDQFPLPEGDRGGTRFYIRVRPSSSTISLHKLWDDLILGSERFQSVRNRATRIRLQPSHSRGAFPQLADTRFDDWALKESFVLSKQQAYRNGTLRGSKDKNDGEVLPSDYVSTVKPIAESQIMLAGYRLADFLKAQI